MKKVFKSCLALLLALLFTASGVACGKTTAPDSSTVPETSVASTAAEKVPVTYVVKSVTPGKDWELMTTPIGKVFFEKTGVNIKFEHSIGDEQQTIALMIASDSLPDVVDPHFNAAPFIDAEVAVEVTDLINSHAPNYKKALGTNWSRMKWSKKNPGRYYLTTPEMYPEPFDNKTQGWFFLQHAVVKELGFPEMKTVDQYENAIREYMAKYPTIDGKPTIGLSLICDDWRWIISLTNPAFIATGAETSGEIYVDPQTRKVTYRETRPEEKEYYKWLNHMYNDGLLDKEAFTQTYDQYKAKIATGRVLALTDMGWEFAEAEQALRQDGKPERTYGYYPIVMKDGIKNTSFVGDRVLSTPNPNLVITKSCKTPERFIQFIDFLMTQEGQVLANWGIEGQHYDIVDGKRVFKAEELEKKMSDPDYSLKTGIGLLASPFPFYYDGVKDETGQYYTVSSKDDVIRKYTDIEKEVLNAYGKKTWVDFFPMPEEFPMRNWPKEGVIVNMLPAESEASIAFQKIQDVVKKDIIKAITSKPSNFEAAWNDFLSDMEKAGVKEFEKACEELMKEQMELWDSEG